MEVECTRHPGASTIGIQLLDETATMAGINPGNPAMSPYAEGKKGTFHTGIIYTVETRKGEGGTTQKLHLKAEEHYNKHMRDPHACGQEKAANCMGLPMLAQSMRWCMCMNKHSKTQENDNP